MSPSSNPEVQNPTGISVILCTHNPREDYLNRVLEGLRCQSLPSSRWELLLIDSASENPLSQRVDLTWHPRGSVLRDDSPGHLRARVRGIQAATEGMLVFVDDDNVLAPDYLEEVLRISDEYPRLGVWGGSVIGEYETPPPAWLEPYEHVISVRRITRDTWSNVPVMEEPWVIGAGMAVRRELAVPYAVLVMTDTRRLMLGRKGTSIMGADDLDFIMSICDQGYGRGVFQSLSVTHLIPPWRCEEEYVWNLAKYNAASMELIRFFRSGSNGIPRSPSLLKRVADWSGRLRLPRHAKRYAYAVCHGVALARRILKDQKNKTHSE